MINPQTLQREKMLFAYSMALEQGDFARLETVLEAAGQDAILERQILEINAALSQSPEGSLHPAPQAFWSGPWQRIKSAWTGLRPRLPRLRFIAFGLAASLVILLGVLALLGPAIGRVFSNVVVALPAKYVGQNYPGLPAPTSAPAATQPVSQQFDRYNNSPYPAPVVILQSTAQASGSGLAEPHLIVHTATLSLEMADTRQARQVVLDMIAEFAPQGAFVVASNEIYSHDDQMPVISMVLRVPVQRYDESMTRLVGLGSRVLSRVENAQDVTQEYVDTTARIAALETSRARLLEIIKDAKTTADLLQAEQELSRREAELESARARQQYLEKTSALSSISLDLRPTVISQPVVEKGWDPAVTLHNAVSELLTSLRNFTDGAIFFVVTTLPWLVVLGLLLYGVFRLIRRKAKK